MTEDPLLSRMSQQLEVWRPQADPRGIFLGCYHLMTQNMLLGLQEKRFARPDWVEKFVRDFADYYFRALENEDMAPQAWKMAFSAAPNPRISAIQNLMLGVNAHINFDLALTLRDLLHQDWGAMTASEKEQYHSDYLEVNNIIASTIDAVQDTILEPAMPAMKWVDDVLGSADEWLTTQLIAHWRDQTWDMAVRLLEQRHEDEYQVLVATLERAAVRRARAISGEDWPGSLAGLIFPMR
ncbi:MAG: hypothetical protein IPL65_20215 [Lewinellaceae bacterium]|nr:hypothetical protein [Lewinellaceae bacterium]